MNLVPTSSTVIAALLLLTGVPAQAAPARGAQDPILQAIDLTTGRSAGAALAQRDTQPFGMVGATWNDPRAVLGGTVEVRVRAIAGGRWTGWQPLDSDGPSPADSGGVDGAGRGRTDPLWVGMSDAVQARVTAGGTLPPGLRLDLINPDAGYDKRGRSGYGAQAQDAADVDVPGRPMPRLVTRSGWGANEAIVKEPPEYTTDVQVVFVHHTAGPNGYRCADSARIVRAIEGYHVNSNHWNDIGYNFLVDKCGNLFEGRKGGVSRAVLGAHTLGFNSHSAAIAVIGDYRGVTVPAVVKNVIAQIAAYKLGAYGNLATARTMLRSGGTDRFPEGQLVSLNRVSGHRDAGSTTCPGNALYGQLGSIRAIAGAGPAGLHLLSMIGATKSGSTFHTRGLVSPLWTTSTPSALLNRFDVYVDGELAASARNMHRRAAVRLSPGRHTVTVRAVHLSGRTASFTVPVIADATAPKFTMGPSVVLRRGSLDGAVPIRVGWSATDAVGLRAVTMTKPVLRRLDATGNGWNGYARPGAATTWSLRVTDRTGNATSASVARTPVVLSEAAAARSGRWATQRDPAHLGGSALRSVTSRSSLSWSFTGRSAALAVSRGGASGRVTVFVDGDRAGTLTLRSAALLHRQAVWVRNWGESGRHTVRIVVASPSAVLDGLAVLR